MHPQLYLHFLLSHSTLVPKFQGENFYANKKIAAGFKQLAQMKGCSVSQIAIAWVTAQGMIALPGTVKTGRLEENWASREINLTEEELEKMRGIVDSLRPVGDRYNETAALAIGN